MIGRVRGEGVTVVVVEIFSAAALTIVVAGLFHVERPAVLEEFVGEIVSGLLLFVGDAQSLDAHRNERESDALLCSLNLIFPPELHNG